MQTKDYVLAAVAIAALLVSAINLYRTQFRRPCVSVTLGPDVHLYHPADGGSALYLPLVFSNTAPVKAVVYQIVLEIKGRDTQSHYLKWQDEVKITNRTWEYTHLSRAKPFTVDGYSSVSNSYWFLWPAAGPALSFNAGVYDYTAHVWTLKNSKPDISVTQELEIPHETALVLKQHFENKDPKSRILFFRHKGLIARMLPRSDNASAWGADTTP